MNPIRVLIVDDSALVRKILTDLLNQDPRIEVVGTAADGAFAMRKIQELKPHVITLDVEMRQVGGLEFLKQLMQVQPLPVIMVSAHTQKGAEVTLKALELGAVDFIAKPQAGSAMVLAQVGNQLIDKVKSAAGAKVRPLLTHPIFTAPPEPPVQLPVRTVSGVSRYDCVVIGASTGGTEAIREVLIRMHPNCPGIAITQHMPEGFTAAFAKRLDGLCEIKVKEAETGDIILPGQALIAPGHSHLKIRQVSGKLQAVLDTGPPVNRHRPSVEVLFLSAAQLKGLRFIGIMLTGMGADGAQAMVQLKNAGAHTIAQDEATCIVFGMPKEAISAGAVHDVLPIDRIADRIYTLYS